MNKQVSPLEAFNYIKKYYEDFFERPLDDSELFNIVETALRTSEKEQQGLVEDYHDLNIKYCELADRYEKEHEALRHIVLKWVIPVFVHNAENSKQYNKDLKSICFKSDYEARKLTQKEFEFLKEFL